MVFPLPGRRRAVGVVFFNHTKARATFSEAQQEFAAKFSQSLSLAYENARLYQAEHDVAERLQTALLELPESLEGVDFTVLYRSASETARVGGDFYDLFPLEHDRLGITIGDISGNGIDAAVLTSLVKTTVRVRASEPGIEPSEVLATANKILLADTAPEVFATVFFGVLEFETGRLVYANGGHTTAAVVSTEGVRALPSLSPIVGAFATTPFAHRETFLAEEDALFLYTDGLTEARGKGPEMYGEQRLFDLLGSLTDADPNALTDAVAADIVTYAAGRLADDMAILALRRRRR
jgi:serine phosphatase RsbU (regulator of sigma subunit)